MKIIICCNKGDYFFTRICVASVRYYYPAIEIFIVRDFLKGVFDTSELERVMNVQVLDLGITRFGWSAAKMHLLLSGIFPGEKLLVLDSDIVFAGKFLEKKIPGSVQYDFAIHEEPAPTADTQRVRDIYYDIDLVKSMAPDFEFPGYFFNGGQMVITTGKLTRDELAYFFDAETYPYWKRLDKFPCVDQSVLNYLLPLKEQRGEIKILKANFMLWTGEPRLNELTIDGLKSGDYEFLVHWAGELRINFPSKMKGASVLHFFEDYYYHGVRFGWLKKQSRKCLPVITYYLRNLYNTFKK